MAQLYLVAFKETNNGTEPEENYALRQLIEEHCSYCIPAGKTEVFGPYTPKQNLAEICWLVQEIGYLSRDYREMIDELREKYTNSKGQRPPKWHEFCREDRETMLEKHRLQEVWKKEKGSLFQWLIKEWTIKLRRPRPLPPLESERKINTLFVQNLNNGYY